jgi:hypothetical protein
VREQHRLFNLDAERLTLAFGRDRRKWPAMKYVKPFAFLLMAVSACVSVWFVGVLKPASVGVFCFFAVWLVSPYVILSAMLVFFAPKSPRPLLWFVGTSVVSLAGILALSDVMFWHKDAQGAIAVIMVPILQAAAAVFLIPVAVVVSRYARRSNRVSAGQR